MKLKSFSADLMMVFSILAACIVVPAGFMFSGSFSAWLKAVGIHASPNLADGYPIAEFVINDLILISPPPGSDVGKIREALSLHRFSIKKVAFRRWSGIGIASRLNLCFEFDGWLPDPHNSAHKFSMTVIHVYIKAPGRDTERYSSDKVANVDFAGPGWDYQVIIDGFHDQARVLDTKGNVITHGLGLYVVHEGKEQGERNDGSRKPSSKTRITAAIPLDRLGDPAKGDWRYYVLVGLPDTGNPSLMLHSGQKGSLGVFAGAVAEEWTATAQEKPRLRALPVRNPN